MLRKKDRPKHYDALIDTFRYYIDLFNGLYRLKTKDEGELNSIYNKIKTLLIDSKIYRPEKMIIEIGMMAEYNNRYMKSYLFLTKLIYDDYHPEDVNVSDIFAYLFYKEYAIILKNIAETNFEYFESQHYTPDVHDEYSIYGAIMNDDLVRFIPYTECEDFNEYQKLESECYPIEYGKLSLLQLCCYHGVVNKIRTINQSKMPSFFFLGGNPDIMHECLKEEEPDEVCMEFAIISHNVDFISYLYNEYYIDIDLIQCGFYQNLEAFLIYLDLTNDIERCFAHSPEYFDPKLYYYLFEQGALINSIDKYSDTALHYAAHHNRIEIAQHLISNGADINARTNRMETPLHFDALFNNIEVAQLLISHGADINAKNVDEETPLYFAVETNSKEIVKLLILHGANINEKEQNGNTPLDNAKKHNFAEIVEMLTPKPHSDSNFKLIC